MLSAVAQVGADVNAMAACPWRVPPLAFVPGLGPRKARTLLAAIAANDNHVKTRVDLLKQVRLRLSCMQSAVCGVVRSFTTAGLRAAPACRQAGR